VKYAKASKTPEERVGHIQAGIGAVTSFIESRRIFERATSGDRRPCLGSKDAAVVDRALTDVWSVAVLPDIAQPNGTDLQRIKEAIEVTRQRVIIESREPSVRKRLVESRSTSKLMEGIVGLPIRTSTKPLTRSQSYR